MPVFRACLQLFRRYLPVISIYFIVFLSISLGLTIMMRPAETDGFGRAGIAIAFLAGEETPLVAGLRAALAGQVDFVALEDETETLQEALFYRQVQYILRVPEGFTASFLRGGRATLQRTAVPGSLAAVHIDLMVERYLEILGLYTSMLPDLSLPRQVAFALNDLAKTTPVALETTGRALATGNRLKFYFNLQANTLMFMIVLGVASVFITFNRLDLKRRNSCSPLGARSIHLQCYLASAAFTLAVWSVLVLCALPFAWQQLTSPGTWLYVLNSLVFCLSTAGLAFLVGNLARSGEVVLAVASIVAQGSSFIGGVFVPQELLSDTVLKLASFTPVYWYVRANNAVAWATGFHVHTLAGFFAGLAIQIGFFLAFVIIALVVRKRGQTAEE